jgi:spore germination protein
MLLALAAFVFLQTPKISAWSVFYDGGISVADLERHASQLNEVSCEWYVCSPSGAVLPPPDKTTALAARVVRSCRANHIPLFGMLQNPNFDPIPVEKLITDPAIRHHHVDEIVSSVVKDGLDGLDLDYELLMAGDRNNFSAFVEELAEALHARHKRLAIALHPKSSEPGTWDGTIAQDWKRIGKVADLVRPMCYDEHWETSEAGPLADPAWVKTIMEFALTVVPPEKLELGIPSYGYDWIGKKGTDLTYDQFMALPGAAKAPRDPISSELVLKFGRNVVYFCDGPAEAPKAALAAELGVRGLCMWRLGAEDPKFWPLLSLRSR